MSSSARASLPRAPQRAFHERISYKDGDETMHMLVDSGASAHFLCTNAFYVKGAERPTSSTITGLAGHTVTASSHGFFQGMLTDSSKRDVHFSGFGVLVPNTTVSLLSVSELVKNGHAVIHMGSGERGTHGMYLTNQGGETCFIPFEWCPRTNLWWVAIRRSSVAFPGYTGRFTGKSSKVFTEMPVQKSAMARVNQSVANKAWKGLNTQTVYELPSLGGNLRP